MLLRKQSDSEFQYSIDVAIVGAGACGLTAALAANESGKSIIVFERDPTPLGTTAMSTGLIPAANTRFQRDARIDDNAELFANDIVDKTHGETDAKIAFALATESAQTIEWLVDTHNIPLSLVDTFQYPGHSVMRMHGTPNRTGRELMGSLCRAAESSGIDILCDATVSSLFARPDDNAITGLRITRPDGSTEDIGCRTVILACCGFAGNQDMVREYLPEIATGVFHGHPGNQGEAIRWGRELGAALADMSAYQGHGGLAKDRGVPILWPTIMQGGVQINSEGRRFSNEARGYSEQAVDVLAQPGGIAWTVFDQTRHEMMKEFEDYHDALACRAVIEAPDLESLANLIGAPIAAITATFDEVNQSREKNEPDSFGRNFSAVARLTPPYYAAKVTGALFHTQGGLVVDSNARVLRTDGSALPNLFAGGGAARGISGSGASGYMAGNGLLTATTFGRLAGTAAATQVNDL